MNYLSIPEVQAFLAVVVFLIVWLTVVAVAFRHDED